MFEILDRETKLLSLSRGLLAEHDQGILSSEICCHISNSSFFYHMHCILQVPLPPYGMLI
jgi:hypothetical protein